MPPDFEVDTVTPPSDAATPAPSEPEAPKNYFREGGDGFDIAEPTILEPDAPAAPEADNSASDDQADTQTPPDQDAEAEAERTRIIAEHLGWRPAPEGRETTAKGEPWLTPEQWVEKFDPRRTREELDALKNDVDRRVETRVGRELDSFRGQLAETVAFQRQQWEQRWQAHIADAPDYQESMRRQQAAQQSLAAFDQKFGAPQSGDGRAAAPAETEPPEPPQDAKEAYQAFAQENRAWYDPTGNGGNRAMTAFAKDIVFEVESDPRFSGNHKAIFDEVANRVREEFKDHALFKPPAAPANGAANSHTPAKPPDIQGASRRGSSGGGKGFADLSPMQKKVYRDFYVTYGDGKDTPEARERYAEKIHADQGRKRGFDIQ